MNPEYQASTMITNEWKLPLNLAIGLHVLLLLSSIYLPGVFKSKPKFAEVTRVSIINVAEPQLAAPAPPPPAQAKVKEVRKEVIKSPQPKKLAPIAEPVPTSPKAAPKAVSLKPLKQKIKKKVEEPKVVKSVPREIPKKPDIDLARQKRQALAEAIRQEELLAEKAQLAREALEMEKSLLQPVHPSPSNSRTVAQNTSTGNREQTRSNSGSSQLEAMYYAAISNRLLQFWALPESIQKKSSLLATAVITIKKDGDIADIFFENRSGDMVFDKFVKQTILAANPMPPIPAALRKQRVEIGLNFKPGGIQSN